MNSPEIALQINGLSFHYPSGQQVLNIIDLTVKRGERIAILGPNGAGKTTFVLHLNGILTPQTGEILVNGVPVSPQYLAEIRRRVGIVFQDPDDQLFMPTVWEDVAFGPTNLGITGSALQSTVDDALTQVGMANYAQHAPHHLSVGQRRRVALAGVLAMRPDIVVLDEPTSNLDPASRRELADILMKLDATIILVTHDLPYAWQLCPRSVILSDGKIVVDGPTPELLANTELLWSHRLELPFGFDIGHLSAR